MSTTHHTSLQISISAASRIAEFISNSQKNGTKVYMEDYFMQLSNAGYSLKTRANLKQEISLKMRADKAAREPAELLTVEADEWTSFLGKGAVAKKPVKELSAKAELMEVPKTLVWETKTKVPVKEELENKDENSVFVKRKIKFEEKTEESVNDDTASSNDDPNDGQACVPPASPAPSPQCPEPGSAWLCSEQDQTPKPQLGDQVPDSVTTLATVSQHAHSGGQDLVNNLQQKVDENKAMQMTAKF
jgi:hypothetical protein